METGKKFLHLIALFILILSGCVKDPQDIPSGLTSDPVFRFNGLLSTQPLNIEAGINGWTMQPIVADDDSLIVYKSIFSKDGCLDDCVPSLEFRFYQAQSSSADPASDFSQTIHTGSKEFILSHEERDSFEITMNTHPGLFMSGFSYWEDLNVPATTYQAEYKDIFGYGEFLNVCFQSLAFTGCQYTQCLYFNPSTLIACKASIQPILEDARTMSLIVKPEGTAPFQIEWFNGSTSQGIILPLQDSTTEVYASVTVTDALGNRTDLNQTIRLQNGIVDACYFPIFLNSTLISNGSNAFTADKVEIIYTDENGIKWSSTSGIQSSNSFISISDVQYYDVSPMNQPAFKTELSLLVDLFNEMTGESKVLEGQEVSIALSHN
jgi:hypothetical protein